MYVVGSEMFDKSLNIGSNVPIVVELSVVVAECEANIREVRPE